MTGWAARFSSPRAIVDAARKNPGPFLPALVSLIVLLGFAFATPLSRLGDASEYLLMTESLYWDHDLKWEPRDQSRHLLFLRDRRLDSPVGLETTQGRDRHPQTDRTSLLLLSCPGIAFLRGFSLPGLLRPERPPLLVLHPPSRSPPPGDQRSSRRLVRRLARRRLLGSLELRRLDPRRDLPDDPLRRLCFSVASGSNCRRRWNPGSPRGRSAHLRRPGSALHRRRVGEQVSHQDARGRRAAWSHWRHPSVFLQPSGLWRPSSVRRVQSFGLRNITLEGLARSLIDPAAGLIWFYPAVVIVLLWAAGPPLLCKRSWCFGSSARSLN